MPVIRFDRGAVVRCHDKTWIVWAYPSGRRHANPLALPVTRQTGPRHRAQVRLDLAGRAVLVHLLDPVSLPRGECQLIGQCAEPVVALLTGSMQRAIAALELERADAARARAVA